MRERLICLWCGWSILMAGLPVFSHAQSLPANGLTEDGKARVQLKGALSARLSYYNASGIDPRYDTWSWTLSGSPVLYWGKVVIPIRILWSDRPGFFGEPYRKFGISPRWEWGQAHLGSNNMHWSPFTVEGRTFTGVGVDINPGLFRFGALYGHFQSTPEPELIYVDTLLGPPETVKTYRRPGYGVRLGVGNKENFVDLIFFKARDDTTSITPEPGDAITSPRENAILGLSSRLRLFKVLIFELDAAASAYTRNLRSDEIDTTDAFLSRILEEVFVPRISSQYQGAVQAGLRLRLPGGGAVLRYRRIDPEYRSMGAYIFQPDLESITLHPDFKLFDKKLKITAGFGWQRNNLSGLRADNSTRLVGSFRARLTLSKTLEWNAGYSNYRINTSRIRTSNIDTLQFHHATQNLNTGIRLLKPKKSVNHLLVVNLNWRSLNTDGGFSANDYRSLGGQLYYNLVFRAAGTNLSMGLNYDAYSYGPDNFRRIFQSAGVRQPFGGKDQFSVSLHNTLSLNYKEGELTTRVLVPRFSLSWRPVQGHRLRIGVSLIQHHSDQAGLPTFTESRGEAGYHWSF